MNPEEVTQRTDLITDEELHQELTNRKRKRRLADLDGRAARINHLATKFQYWKATMGEAPDRVGKWNLILADYCGGKHIIYTDTIEDTRYVVEKFYANVETEAEYSLGIKRRGSPTTPIAKPPTE